MSLCPCPRILRSLWLSSALSLAGQAGSARSPGLSWAPGPQGEHRGDFGVSLGPQVPHRPWVITCPLSLGLHWLPGSHGAGRRERQEGESALSLCIMLSHPSGPFSVPHILLCHPLWEPEWGWAELKAGEGTQPHGPLRSRVTCPLANALGHALSPRGACGGLPCALLSPPPLLSPQGKAGQAGQTGQRGPPVSKRSPGPKLGVRGIAPCALAGD